jgi:hypothetical protein
VSRETLAFFQKLHNFKGDNIEEISAILRAVADHEKRILAGADHWFWEVTSEGEYVNVTPGITRLGYDPADIIGNSYDLIIPPERIDFMRAIQGRYNKHRVPFMGLRHHLWSADKSRVPVACYGLPALNGDHSLRAYHGLTIVRA